MVTHDQKKDIINIYTSMPWAPLCEEVAKLKVKRRPGQLFVLPKASNGEDEPQLGMFEGADPARPPTSAATSVQNAQRPDPKKLWDVRPLLKKALVEAPGIESWEAGPNRTKRAPTGRPGATPPRHWRPKWTIHYPSKTIPGRLRRRRATR